MAVRKLVAVAAVTPLLRWAVLVHAVPPDQPWRANCPHCGTSLTPGENLASLLPPGRCGNCRRQIGAPPYAVELAAVAALALLVFALPGRSRWEAVAFLSWAWLAVALSFIDLAVHRLPFRLTVPAAVSALALLGGAALTAGTADDWLRALIAGAGCGSVFAVFALLLGPRAFGLGDAGMVIGVGALLGWLGWAAVLAGLFLAFLGSGLVALVLLVSGRAARHDALPFGPYLAAGTLLTLAWVGQPLS